MNMPEHSTQKREPLFHITKNDAIPAKKSLLIRLSAILLALLTIGILSVILIRENPFRIYGALFGGAFIDVWSFLQNSALLLLFGLAVLPAFRMKYWNMGANGAVLVGTLAAIACMKFLPADYQTSSLSAFFKENTFVLMLVMVIAAILASVVWSVIPAFFKAFFRTNETLFTLMMNYIAATLVEYFVFAWDKSLSGKLGIVNGNKSGELRHIGWFPEIGNEYVLPLIVALLVTVFITVYMRFSKHGFEVAVIGESVPTARYAGIHVKWVIIRTLIISGVICGLIGALYAGSVAHTVNSSIGGKGFTAILVAWLADFDPVIMLITSLFIVYLNTGAENISSKFNLGSNDYANIVVGIVFFFVIGSEFFIRYSLHLNSTYRDKLQSLLSKIFPKKEENK